MINLNFSSPFFTASLPLIQSQIPNPKFPQFQRYSFRNRQAKRCRFIVPHASSSELPLLPVDINQVSFRTDSSFSSVRLSLFFWNFSSFFFLLRNNFARRVWKMLVLMILCSLFVFVERFFWYKKIIGFILVLDNFFF